MILLLQIFLRFLLSDTVYAYFNVGFSETAVLSLNITCFLCCGKYTFGLFFGEYAMGIIQESSEVFQNLKILLPAFHAAHSIRQNKPRCSGSLKLNLQNYVTSR
jgi:hypothetical protein